MTGKDLMQAIMEMPQEGTDTASPLTEHMKSINTLCDELEGNQDDGKN